jgi:hypothetical protein
MAYISPETKQELTPEIKAVLKKYNMKGTISTPFNSTLVVSIFQGPLDLVDNFNKIGNSGGYYQNTVGVNESFIESDFSGESREFLIELRSAMMKGNEMVGMNFDVGWFVNINIGTNRKPYVVVK